MANIKCYTSESHQIGVFVPKPTGKLSRRKGTRIYRHNENEGKNLQQYLASALFVALSVTAILGVNNFLSSQMGKYTLQNFNEYPQVDDHELAYSTWYLPYIHVVNTRFMQNEARLQNLAQARLNLFETFCLPSMIGQQRIHDFSSDYDDAIDAFILEEYSNINRSTLKDGYKKMDNKEEIQLKEILKMQNFLWIIKIDPLLPYELIRRLQIILKPYPNFFLVGSNTNFGVGSKHGSWRDGEAGNDLLLAANYSHRKLSDNKFSSRVYNGDMRLLKLAHQYREDRIIIETRLDADDGLHQNYLSTIQHNAMNIFGSDVAQKEERKSYNNYKPRSESIKWMYWCATNHIEWFSESSRSSDVAITKKNSLNLKRVGNMHLDPNEKEKFIVEREIMNELNFGTLFVPTNEGGCITPGISLAITIGIEEEEIQRYPHNKLVQMIWKEGRCGTKNPKQCLQFLQKLKDETNSPGLSEHHQHEGSNKNSTSFMAIRARTPTSAGMKDVQIRTSHESLKDMHVRNKIQKKRWERLQLDFGISAEMAKSSNEYIKEHMREIAIDNIKGQGTKGHR